jgi:hypothetical protein
MFYDFIMSADEKKTIDTAGKIIERKLRRLAKAHMQGLSEILGALQGSMISSFLHLRVLLHVACRLGSTSAITMLTFRSLTREVGLRTERTF